MGTSTSFPSVREKKYFTARRGRDLLIATASSLVKLSATIIIDTSTEFLKHLPETWKELDVKDLRVLKGLFFNSNLIYTYPGIKTPEVCCIYNVKAEFLEEKNRFVTLIRADWNQLVREMSFWHQFGREISSY